MLLYFIVGKPLASSWGVAEASISTVGTFAFFFASSHAGLLASQWGHPSIKNNTRRGCFFRSSLASSFLSSPRRTVVGIYISK
jgi:hypothetical protein